MLMRHAKAADAAPLESDFQRCLTADGQRIATETGTTLLACGIRIDRVIASTAERTCQTADLVTAAMSHSPKRLDMDELYMAPEKTLESTLCEHTFEDESSVMVVGHNPGIARLICRWAARSLSVSPATVAVFRSSAHTWLDVRKTKVHIPELVCVLQDGRIAWQRDSEES